MSVTPDKGALFFIFASIVFGSVIGLGATLLENQGHITAEQVLENVNKRSPAVNMATVYRNLDTLRHHGILTVTALPDGPLQWELISSDPHHHLICESCHRVEQIPHAIV